MRRHLASAVILIALAALAACHSITAPQRTANPDDGTDQQITVGPHP